MSRECCSEFAEKAGSCCTATGKHIAEFAKSSFSLEVLRKRLPIITWIPKYRLRELQGDIVAGLTVGLMVVPQALAYANIAGLPPQYGLYSSFMGCFVYCVLGTSRDIAACVGPSAILGLITYAFALSPVPGDPTFAIVLTLGTGIVQVIMGFLHLGFIIRFISYTVMNAFTSAAALTIAGSQVKLLFGLKKMPGDFFPMIYETINHIKETDMWDLTMGVCCIVAITFLKNVKDYKLVVQCLTKANKNKCLGAVKYSLWLIGVSRNAIVVIAAAIISYLLIENGGSKLTVCGKLPPGVPAFRVPSFTLYSNGTNGTVINYGVKDVLGKIGIGFLLTPTVGLIESIAIGKAFSRKHNYKMKASQELIAYGLSNILGSFVMSFPITGSFSRTAVAAQSGVRTPAAAIVTGAIVLLSLAFLTPLFFYIPSAALAAVIITAVIPMIDVYILKYLWIVKKAELIPWVITFVLAFVLGIQYGILIGVGISMIILLIPASRPGTMIDDGDIVVIQLDRGIQFPAQEYLANRVQKHGLSLSGAKSVILDFTHISVMDYTVVQGLKELADDMKTKQVFLVIACIRTDLLKSILKAEIPHLRHSPNVNEAIKLVEDLSSNPLALPGTSESMLHLLDFDQTLGASKTSLDQSHRMNNVV